MNYSDYKTKYEKYYNKNSKLLDLFYGGNKNSNKKYIKLLHKIKENMKEKGFVFWFDGEGKIIAKDLNSKSAQVNVLNTIRKNKDMWKNKTITELVMEFDPENIMDDELGGLKITIELNKIIFHGDDVSIQQKNKTNSLFELRYKYDELVKFKASELKKLSLFISNEVLNKISPFKTYHYKDVEKHM